jgi:aldehyde dehydrogenase (NAD+)
MTAPSPTLAPEDARVRCLIDGELVGADFRPVVDPATEDEVASFAVADTAMVERAAESAAGAYEGWRQTHPTERIRIVLAIADEIERSAEELASALVLEQGKPLVEARGEIEASVYLLRAESGAYTPDELSEQYRSAGNHERRRSPLGVVAAIVPWNFPVLISASKIAPALLSGSPVIVKPAPTSPLTTMMIAHRIAHLTPPGVLQVLGDAGHVGPQLTADHRIRRVSFTGSTATGRLVMAASAPTLKRLTLELGGNDAAILLDDVDLDQAAEGIFAAAFTNAGQVCGAIKRVFVHRGRSGDLIDALDPLVRRVRLGHGLDPATTMGPVQNGPQYRRGQGLVSAGEREGKTLSGGSAADGPGFFMTPRLIGGLSDANPLVAEEQFCPVLPILEFDEDDEAIVRANQVPFGLTASVWSGDLDRAHAVASRLDSGLVCINTHNDGPADLPVPLSKQSGIGWLGGREGLDEYRQTHVLVTHRP